MTSVLPLESVKDTWLWQQLFNGFDAQDGALARTLSDRLVELCSHAESRMKLVPTLMGQYTLHDEVHLRRVAEFMARIQPDQVKLQLNPVEIYLLVLSAFFHDQGMVLSAEKLKNLESDTSFVAFRNRWSIDHPNYDDLVEQEQNPVLNSTERARYRSRIQEMDAAVLTDYVRESHGRESAAYVRSTLANDPRMEIARTNITGLLADLCQSHTESWQWITSGTRFRVDEVIGTYKVNMRFLATLLRLADILDFDKDRTPEGLYRTIHFSSPVSLTAWRKHLSVEGWIISPTAVQFTVRCEHPVYQRAVLRNMDWIDEELAGAHDMIGSFPQETREKYWLNLPARVDRSRIEPKDEAYRYHDLEFNLARDELVNLLMTDKLYSSPNLAVRELVQNSLDALRLRKAIKSANDGSDWIQGEVKLIHEINADGFEVLRCVDNGVGMDEDIVTRFLTNAGRSYYRSPEYRLVRDTLKSAGVDFDPCAQFGIGFMSVFMIGDHVRIWTRRDYGSWRAPGEPLEIEINGLNGMLLIRDGKSDQPVGTTIEITGRKKPEHFAEWLDRIKLLDTLEGYILGAEFPVSGICTIPEIKGEVQISSGTRPPVTLLEHASVKKRREISQPLSDIDDRLEGALSTSFLVDDDGRLVLGNDEARWQIHHSRYWGLQSELFKNGESEPFDDNFVMWSKVCSDGVLIAGAPESLKGHRGYWIGSNPLARDRHTFALYTRGELKPEITPARTSRVSYSLASGWHRLDKLLHLAQGRLWERVLDLTMVDEMETFWALASIYRVDLCWIRSQILWERLKVPVCCHTGETKWLSMADLDTIWVEPHEAGDRWRLSDDSQVVATSTLSQWNTTLDLSNVDKSIQYVIAAVSTVEIHEGKWIYRVSGPTNSDISAISADERYPYGFSKNMLRRQPFGKGLEGAFAALSPISSMNTNHPIVQVAFRAETLNLAEATPSQAFGLWLGFVSTQPRIVDWIRMGRVDRYMVLLGWLYLRVDWSQCAEELRPPYIVMTLAGPVTITAEMLLGWSILREEQTEAVEYQEDEYTFLDWVD